MVEAAQFHAAAGIKKMYSKGGNNQNQAWQAAALLQ
jgi:hypothetical protein